MSTSKPELTIRAGESTFGGGVYVLVLTIRGKWVDVDWICGICGGWEAVPAATDAYDDRRGMMAEVGLE